MGNLVVPEVQKVKLPLRPHYTRAWNLAVERTRSRSKLRDAGFSSSLAMAGVVILLVLGAANDWWKVVLAIVGPVVLYGLWALVSEFVKAPVVIQGQTEAELAGARQALAEEEARDKQAQAKRERDRVRRALLTERERVSEVRGMAADAEATGQTWNAHSDLRALVHQGANEDLAAEESTGKAYHAASQVFLFARQFLNESSRGGLDQPQVPLAQGPLADLKAAAAEFESEFGPALEALNAPKP